MKAYVRVINNVEHGVGVGENCYAALRNILGVLDVDLNDDYNRNIWVMDINELKDALMRLRTGDFGVTEMEIMDENLGKCGGVDGVVDCIRTWLRDADTAYDFVTVDWF